RPYFDRGHELVGYDGALDFLGVNYYARRIVRAGAGPLRADRVDPERAEHTAIGWEVHPASFRKLLVRLHEDYAPRHVYVTENGAAYDDAIVDDRVDDPARVSFLAGHFDAAATALTEGAPLRGCFLWTLLDTCRWAHGGRQPS